MDARKRNYWVDFLMLVAFLVTAITGVVLFVVLPGGLVSGPFREFLGTTRHIWRDVHNWVGLILIVLVLIHLVLHWRWVVETTHNVFSKKKTKKK